ncbi:hypothetical protein [Paracoccus luteus]|uniref:hypothetical protein n=1 Tax=Paracoccus luteus TaxID=2508543 RepID=UPI00106FEE91|nr:hypothetical protein [Paracoccus luteus]
MADGIAEGQGKPGGKASGPPILGFRQDRVGARLIGILNVLRLRHLFGADAARFAWLSQPGGPYPDLSDPAEIFAPGFVADVMDLVPERPALAGRESLTAAAVRMRADRMAGLLAQGARWHCDAAFDMVAFQGERPPQVARATAALVAALPLAAPLTRALDAAMARVATVAAGPPAAIHVRRGDILDGDPWSYAAWPSKYVPDEFFRAFVETTQGPVLAFSDTPAAIPHLAQGHPRIVAVAGLLADHGLTTAQQDVMELLLMARCAQVGAPAYSAFSRAAQVMGGARVVALPSGLARPARIAAHDALMDRALTRGDSFLARGDLAQSVVHVAAHAAATGRDADLVAGFARRPAFLHRFPFVAGEVATAALRAGQPRTAADLAAALLKNPRVRPGDRTVARQIGLLEAARDPAGGDGDPACDLVTELFVGRRSDSGVMPRLAWALLGDDGPAGAALMMSADLAHRLALPQVEGGPPALLPPWTVQVGWAELIQQDDIRRRLHQSPLLPRALAPAADALAAAEEALATPGAPPPPGDAELLGFAASVLVMHNRLARAMRLLEWLIAVRPDDAMLRKRMADACFAAGNAGAGWRWLDGAIQRTAPDTRSHALLRVAAASRAGKGDPRRAAAHLQAASNAWPGLGLIARVSKGLGQSRRPSGGGSGAAGAGAAASPAR